MANLKTPGKTLGESLREHGVSRRGFIKFCAATDHDQSHRGGPRTGQASISDLVVVSGVHRLHRVPYP